MVNTNIIRRLFRRKGRGTDTHHHHEHKEDSELEWQKQWVDLFRANKPKAQEYWEKFRYLDDIKSTTGINSGSRVLDVGCGISSVLHFVEGERYGIDPLADEYKKLYSYPDGINVQKADGENLPFADAYFDVVFCSNVLDHVTDPVQTIDGILRVLKPGGYFVFTIEVFGDGTHRDDPHHPHTMTPTTVDALIKDKFRKLWLKESPWIGLRGYVRGFTEKDAFNKELIMVLQKPA